MVESKLNNILKKYKRLSILYVGLIVLFLLIMSISYAIPTKSIIDHTRESLPILETEGPYPQVMSNSNSNQLDNFTDAWMLSIAMDGDSRHPVKSALENSFRKNDNAENKVDNLSKTIDDDNAEKGSYSRYWHGYLMFLKPLLTKLNYEEIRYINSFILIGVFILVCYLIKRELGTRYSLAFMISMIMIRILIAPMSLQFSNMFYVMFLSTIAILIYHKKIKVDELGIYIFFIIGSITSFFDLLTAPLLSLGIPLITYLMLEERENKLIKNFIITIKLSIFWTIGYAATWASKWIIASAVLRKNIVKESLSQILVRTSSTAENAVLNKYEIIQMNNDLIFNDITIKIFLVILLLWLIILLISRKNKIINMLPILIIGIYPYIWYSVLKNHSYMHSWFTYRSLGITVFSVLVFMSYSIDKTKIKDKLKKYRKIYYK